MQSPQTYNKLNFGDTLVDIEKIQFIKNKIIELNEINDSIAEVGVYKAGTAKIILESMNKNSSLYLFDTFEGIPNSSEYDNIHVVGDFIDSPYDDIVKYFSDYNNVKIYRGVFPKDTSVHINDKKFKIVHLDVDTYISYKESLEFFYDRIIIGDI